MKWWMKAAIPVVVMPAMVFFGYRSIPSPAPAGAVTEGRAQPAPAKPERRPVETKADDAAARREKARLEAAAEAEAAKRQADAERSASPELTAKEELGGAGRPNPLGRSPAPLLPAEMRRPEKAPGEPALVSEADEDCKTCRQVESQADLRISFQVRKGLGGRQQTYPVVHNLRPYPQRDIEVRVSLDGFTRTWKFQEVAAHARVSGMVGLDVPRRRNYYSSVEVTREGKLMGKHVPRTETVCDPGTGRGSLAFQEPGR